MPVLGTSTTNDVKFFLSPLRFVSYISLEAHHFCSNCQCLCRGVLLTMSLSFSPMLMLV
jgi:hypothetical protein